MKNTPIFKLLLFTFITSSLIVTTCSKDNNPTNSNLNEDLSKARKVAELLESNYNLSDSSLVLLGGPIEPGTIIKSFVLSEDQPDSLYIPNADGDYYYLFIDEQPNLFFDHQVKYGWINANEGNFKLTKSNNKMLVYRPNIVPTPFSYIGDFTVTNTEFIFVSGEGAPKFNDYSHKNSFSKYPYSNKSYYTMNPERMKIKRALVLDAGDADTWSTESESFTKKRNWGTYAENFSKNADPFEEWLKEYDFNVDRYSQYWGNSHNYFKSSSDFYSAISRYGDEFSNLGKPDWGCDEFFLYITGHGQERSSSGAFNLYIPSNIDDENYEIGPGDFSKIQFSGILSSIESSFPNWVKVTIFIDACYCGKMITGNTTRINNLCNNLCALTIITTTDDKKEAIVPTTLWDSGTEDFMEGASKDLDGDGTSGDIQDRFMEMESQNSSIQSTNPKSFHCPINSSWCSTDSPIGDEDGDGIADTDDNCPDLPTSNQSNSDNDKWGDECDNCPQTSNDDQLDSDGDGIGDACDNCPNLDSQNQTNSDNDKWGDECDNCDSVSNDDQQNSDSDHFGDACDNCPEVGNADQKDTDDDGVGDECDPPEIFDVCDGVIHEGTSSVIIICVTYDALPTDAGWTTKFSLTFENSTPTIQHSNHDDLFFDCAYFTIGLFGTYNWTAEVRGPGGVTTVSGTIVVDSNDQVCQNTGPTDTDP